MFRCAIGPESELRLLEERHAEEVFALVDGDRAYLRAWLPWVDRSTEVEVTRSFIRHALEQFARNEILVAGVWHQDRFAGCVGTVPINWADLSVEIGYWLGKNFQGQGLVTNGVKSLVRHAFTEWRLNRVVIRCATANIRSQGVPKRLGFTLEGTLRQAHHVNGEFQDLHVYSQLSREWTGF